MSHWNAFLQTDIASHLVSNCIREIENMSLYMLESNNHDDNLQEPDSGEKEEWMYFAELQSECIDDLYDQDSVSDDYWLYFRNKYSIEQIGDMPLWISNQKKDLKPHTVTNTTDIYVKNFHEAQHRAYSTVFDHYVQEAISQLLLIITGLAGSGKSYVIDGLKDLLKDKCKVCAFFGMVSFNVKGRTLYSLLYLPIRGKKYAELKAKSCTSFKKRCVISSIL